MNQTILKNFIELAAFDQQFFEIEKKIAEIKLENQKLIEQLALLDKDMEMVQSKQTTIAEQLKKQEEIVQDTQNEETRLQELSKSLTKAQDCQAAIKDLEHLKLTRNQQEQKMIVLSNKASTMIKDIEVYRKQYQQKQEELRSIIALKEQEILQTQEKLQQFHQERTSKVAHLPSDWLSRYQIMREKVCNPFVPASQESCSACFYFMSSHDVQLLKEKGVLQCKDCFRFIYLEQ